MRNTKNTGTTVLRVVLRCLLTAVSIFASSLPQAQLPEPLAYYPLNGDGTEYTGNNIDLDPVGSPVYVDSFQPGFGQALSLGGVEDALVGSGYNFSTSGALSISAWVNPATLAQYGSIIKNWNGQFHFGIDSSGSAGLGLLSNYINLSDIGGQPVVASPSPLVTNSWSHVAVTIDSSSMLQTLYINGQEVATASFSGTLRTSPPPCPGLGLGVKDNCQGTAASGNVPGFWHGELDDIALWDSVLSSQQIADIYQQGLNGQPLLGGEAPVPQVLTRLIAQTGQTEPEGVGIFTGFNKYAIQDNIPRFIARWRDRDPAVSLNGASFIQDIEGQLQIVFHSTNQFPLGFSQFYPNNFSTKNGGVSLTGTGQLQSGGVHRGLWQLDGSTVSLVMDGQTLNRYGDGVLYPTGHSGGDHIAISTSGTACAKPFETNSYDYLCTDSNGEETTCTRTYNYCSKHETGLYYYDSSSLNWISDNRTFAFPGQTETVDYFWLPRVINGSVSSAVYQNPQSQLVEWNRGETRVIAGKGVATPDGGFYRYVHTWGYDRFNEDYYTHMGWFDGNDQYHYGVARFNADEIQLVLPFGAVELAIPKGENTSLSAVNKLSVSESAMALLGWLSRRDPVEGWKSGYGVFLFDQQLYPLLLPGEVLSGKTVSWANINDESLSGYTVLAHVEFEDKTRALVELALDRDADDIADSLDNCLDVPNADQSDANGNGIGNACEDADNDLVLDIVDNCPAVANPDQFDDDGDAVGNLCDICPLDADPNQLDSDGDNIGNACDFDNDNDLIADTLDNCPTHPNAAQLDLDGDNIGDACDQDKDGDGIFNEVDGQWVALSFIDESDMASLNYTDGGLGGQTFGTIGGSGSLQLEVIDAPDSSEGILLTVVSGTGKLQVNTCSVNGKGGKLHLSAGNSVVVTCGSATVRAIGGTIPMVVDDVAMIVEPGAAMSMRETDSGDVEVASSPQSFAEGQVLVGQDLTLTIPVQSAAVISEPEPDSYSISNEPTSLLPVLVDNGNGQVVELLVGESGRIVAIDILPEDAINILNPGSKGNVPVAIFSTAHLDAPNDIDPFTISMAGAMVKQKRKGNPQVSSEDVNNDGLLDFVVHIETEALELNPSDVTIRLSGQLYTGETFYGSDAVIIASE